VGNEKFAAYYEGKRIASAGKLEELLNMTSVRRFIGKKEFLIRRLYSGKAEVIFRGDVGLLKKE
jgi:hypothetical protein